MQILLAWCVAADLATQTNRECTSWAGALSHRASENIATISDQLQLVVSPATDWAAITAEASQSSPALPESGCL